MRSSVALLFPLLLATSVAFAAPHFYESGTLGDGTTVRVGGGGTAPVEFFVNFEPFPTQTSNDPGCGVVVSRYKARRLGAIYRWAATEYAPQSFEKVVGLYNGGQITINRGPTGASIESVIDDGNNVTGISLSCFIAMSDEDAWMVGSWLREAGMPTLFVE